MYNMQDYLTWRGDLSMEVSPLNEVDNLIFASIAYINMDGLFPADDVQGIPLQELYEAYKKAGYDQSDLLFDPLPLLRQAAHSIRFGKITAHRYVNQIDPQKQVQFSAVTYALEDGTHYVAFRGTDDTIVGWREDFNISYLDETPGQSEAVRYLNHIAAETSGPLIVGGHSKGGNLAVYAGAFCEPAVQERILRIYSNDGPGFNENTVETQEYQAILPKVQVIIPESSLIGILLSNKEEREIIKSSANGLQQHNPYSWAVLPTSFETADGQSPSSQWMDETFSRWIGSLDEQEREAFVTTVFDSLDASGADTFAELDSHRWNSYQAILKATVELNSESREHVITTLKKLAATGREVWKDEVRKSMSDRISETLRHLLPASKADEDKP